MATVAVVATAGGALASAKTNDTKVNYLQTRIKVEQTHKQELETKARQVETQNAEAQQQLKTDSDNKQKEIDDLKQQLQAKREAQQNEAQLASAVKSVLPVQTAYASGGSCSEWMRAAGVDDPSNAMVVINRESGCNPNSVNRSSGACGIGQALPCSKMPCAMGDGYCQMRWTNEYAHSRYGSWAGARAHSDATGWY